jgi:chromosome segregation ATPase
MPKETDWSQIENKVKLSLLQAEKRLVDLELAVSELKELKSKLSDFDPGVLQKIQEMGDVRQRIEDLEDMAMVENLGVGEVKQMMEEIAQKMENQQAGPQHAEATIDQSTTTSIQPQAAAPADDTIAVLDEIKTKIDELSKVQGEIDSLRGEIASIKSSSPKPAAAASISPADRQKMDNLSRDIDLVNTRISTMESVVRQISMNVDKFSTSLERFSTYEKATAMSESMERKIDELKSVEAEVRRLSGKMEGVYENIDKRLESVKGSEKRLPEIADMIHKLEREIDENRVLILGRVKKEDIDGLRKTLENVTASVAAMKASSEGAGQTMAKVNSIGKMVDEIDARLKAMQAKYANLESSLSSIKPEDAGTKINDLVSQKFDGLKKDLELKALEAKDVVSVMNFQMSQIANRIVSIESRLSAIEKLAEESLEERPIILE